MQDFWLRVQVGAPDQCWPWLKGVNRHGYGRINVGRIKGVSQIKLAHRLAYELTFGPPVGVVRHQCHNPPCCNPNHLLDGTQADNMQDAIRAGRLAKEFALPHTKLSDAEATAIRTSVDRGVDLAASYGVSPSTICDIRKGRTRR